MELPRNEDKELIADYILKQTSTKGGVGSSISVKNQAAEQKRVSLMA